MKIFLHMCTSKSCKLCPKSHPSVSVPQRRTLKCGKFILWCTNLDLRSFVPKSQSLFIIWYLDRFEYTKNTPHFCIVLSMNELCSLTQSEIHMASLKCCAKEKVDFVWKLSSVWKRKQVWKLQDGLSSFQDSLQIFTGRLECTVLIPAGRVYSHICPFFSIKPGDKSN